MSDVASLSAAELIKRIALDGSRILQSARQRLANLGDMDDDWGAPFPLRVDAQVAYLFLGAIDAFDVGLGILRARASQQAFNTLRFQLESLALIRWMSAPPDAAERQHRAYRVVCGELRRFGKFMIEDAGRDRTALKDVHHIQEWGRQLRSIAAEEGITHLKGPPDRRKLLGKHGETSGYPTWSMLSELGSHPPAPGHTLLMIEPGAHKISYDLERPSVARAFFAATAIAYAWQTCEAVSKALGWGRWLSEEAAPMYQQASVSMLEAMRRRQAERSPRVPPGEDETTRAETGPRR